MAEVMDTLLNVDKEFAEHVKCTRLTEKVIAKILCAAYSILLCHMISSGKTNLLSSCKDAQFLLAD